MISKIKRTKKSEKNKKFMQITVSKNIKSVKYFRMIHQS